MQVDMITGAPIDEVPPPVERHAPATPHWQQQARVGEETERLVASSEGQAIVDKLSDILVRDLARLIADHADEGKDRAELAAIRGAYRTLAALGYEIAVGRLAAAKLAEQAMPVRADG